MRDRRPPPLFISMMMMMIAMMTHGLSGMPVVRSGAGIGTSLNVTPRPCAIRPMSRVTPACNPGPVLAAGEIRRHVVAAHLGGKAVGDEFLQVVAHLDLHAAIFYRQHHEQPVVFALVANATPAVLEHLHRVLTEVGVRRERLDCCDDYDVACCLLQRQDAPFNLGLARRIDDAREIVDGLCQLSWQRLSVSRCDGCNGCNGCNRCEWCDRCDEGEHHQ